jgi:ABC-type branched-subunit amino acid transport system ATPase component
VNASHTPGVLLETRDLVAGYTGNKVLHRVNLTLRHGELISLVGANGAGKSTLLKTIMGTLPTLAGSIRLAGRTITSLPTWRRVALGVAFSPEGRRVFPGLSVEENLLMGAVALPKRNKRHELERVTSLFPILGERLDQRGGDLSGGEAQMVAIGRAMMAQPRVLLVEEPSQGLAPLVIDRVYHALREIADEGIGVLVAEQFQQVRTQHCDRILIIDRGSIAEELDTQNETTVNSLVTHGIIR